MPQSWEDAKDMLVRTYKYTGAVFYMGLFTDASLVVNTFTATPSTNIINPSVSGSLVAGCRVRLTTTGTLPPPLALGTDYFVIGTSPTTLQLSTTLNGTPIDITGTGSGTHTITEQAPNRFAPLAVWARLEANYQGSGRQPLSWATANLQDDFVNNRVFLDGVYYSFNPINGPISYRWWGLICDGTATRLDATGRIRDVRDAGSLQTQPQGTPLEEVFRPSVTLPAW